MAVIIPSNTFIKHAERQVCCKHCLCVNSFNSHNHAMRLLPVIIKEGTVYKALNHPICQFPLSGRILFMMDRNKKLSNNRECSSHGIYADKKGR